MIDLEKGLGINSSVDDLAEKLINANVPTGMKRVEKTLPKGNVEVGKRMFVGNKEIEINRVLIGTFGFVGLIQLVTGTVIPFRYIDGPKTAIKIFFDMPTDYSLDFGESFVE